MTFYPAKGPRQRSLSLLLVLIVLGLALVPGTVRPAHASTTGLICLADVGSAPLPPASPCPKPPFFNGPVTSPDQQLRIGVFAYNSSGLDGFDVVLLADHTVLKPAGVDLTGSVLSGSTVVLVKCLSGVNVTGAICPSTDTIDTLDFSIVQFGPNTPTPTTGLLFTAIYNITGTTSPSGISIGYQTGCSTSSDGTYCVTIANGTPVEVPETVQGATFNNNTPPPYLTVSANSTTIGPIAVHNFAGLQLNLTGQNGWNNEGCPCPVALSTAANTSLTVRLNTTSVNAPPTGSVYASLNVTASTGGNFSLTVYAQYPSLDLNNFNSSTLVAHVTVTVRVSDFALSANPAVSTLLVGLAGSTVITASGENGFTGPVQLSVASTAGQCSLSPTTATVPGSETSQLTCTFTSAGNFAATVTGRNVLDSHTVQVNFVVQDFAISLSSSQLTVQAGSSQSFDVTVLGLNGFTGSVTVAVTPPQGVSVTPASTTIQAPGKVSLSLTGDVAGNYTVDVDVISGGVSHSVSVQVQVTPKSSSGNILGLAPLVFYSIIAGLGAIAVVLALVLFRHRKRSPPTTVPSKKAPGKKVSNLLVPG